MKQGSKPVVLTVGHSTRPLAEFIALLAAHLVHRLIDVRTVPRSRHNPQFNRDTLPAALEGVGIRYAHVAGLGGFRPTQPGSLNMGLLVATLATATEIVAVRARLGAPSRTNGGRCSSMKLRTRRFAWIVGGLAVLGVAAALVLNAFRRTSCSSLRLLRSPPRKRRREGCSPSAARSWRASEVLAKHDENYMPPEAKAAVDQAQKDMTKKSLHEPKGTR